MKIAIDVSSIARRDKSGVAISLTNLLDSLAAVDGENEYLICYRFSRLKHWRSIYVPPAANFHLRVIQEPFLFPRKAGVFHDGDARLPKCSRMPLTVTVYDLFSLLRSDLATDEFRRKKCRRYQEIADRAARVIACSENTKRDLVRELTIPESRICVVYPCISGRFAPQQPHEVEMVRQKYNLPKPYLLSVASFSKRKNIDRLLQAYGELRKAGRIESALVLTGSLEHWGDWRQAVEQHRLGGSIVLTGYVPDEDLPAIYSGARAFLFPSLYEGFGLPLLEAMRCGTPVLTSNVSSMPEVVGDAGLLVPPEDLQQIEERIAEIDADPALRERLSQKGLRRAAEFSSEESARKLIGVWREIAH